MKFKRLGKISTKTKVSFNLERLDETAKIVEASCISESENLIAITTDKSSFHPVSYSWADQPADKGILIIDGKENDVINVVVSACLLNNNEIVYHSDIPACIKDMDVAELEFGVSHIIQTTELPENLINKNVCLRVDKKYRYELSSAHTACHLMALALNKIIAPYWGKEVAVDSLDNPDFDKLAIQKSKISSFKSCDTFRLGKSIRKKGLDTEKLWTDLETITKNLELTINNWVSSATEVKILCETSNIMDRRKWLCFLDNHEASIYCGGTHLKSLVAIDHVNITIIKSATELEFEIQTFVKMKDNDHD